MELKKRSLSSRMRLIHRDLGFLIIGLTLIYALSGLVMIYRDADLLKVENSYHRQVDAGLSEKELAKALKVRSVKVVSQQGDLLILENGTYNQSTGEADYRLTELVAPLNKMSRLHKTFSESDTHYWGILYAFLLSFMALSSLFMIPKGAKRRRAIFFIVGGVVGSTLLILLI